VVIVARLSTPALSIGRAARSKTVSSGDETGIRPVGIVFCTVAVAGAIAFSQKTKRTRSKARFGVGLSTITWNT
jgi:predicted permease